MISMQVVKRNGEVEAVSFDKVLNRIQSASDGLDVNPTLIAQRTLLRIYDGVKTSELDELAAQLSISLMTTNPDYGTLAARLAISNHHRNTSNRFTDVIYELSHQTLEKTGETLCNISQELIDICEKHGDAINQRIDYQRDYLFDYFGFKTLEKLQYLLRDTKGRTLERPQHLIMRVSLALWGASDLERAFETYELLSQKYFIHATPTNFNAGTPRQQLSSCFLLAMKGDSINGIYDTLKDCALISKHAGGIGLHLHDIRAKGSLIRGTNGTSNGIVPMLRNFNDTARYVDQGGGKRNGSFAMYLEPWHADVEDFLRLKLNTGSEEERCRDLFYGLWIPDLFMERVEKNTHWTLFCPSEAPGLSDVYGDEFKALYERYEAEGRGRKQVDAQKLWFKVLDSQIETGTPYLLYKDAANMKSNQKNVGTIKSSNLCTEIIEYSSPTETAVCNLASLALPSYVDAKKRIFDFEKLRQVVKVATKNLNRVIDINYYPTPETKTSNMRHRPVGLGVQGLADVFALLRMPWESEKAADLNQRIFEHIYYAAVEASSEIAIEEGPYSTYEGSPMSQGIFQYDMWSVTPMTEVDGTLDWAQLKEKVKKNGVRNSLLVAPMPTASTSQILGFNECLTGDTLVSLPNGICKRLDKFTNKEEMVNTYDDILHEIRQENQYEFLEKGEKYIHEITLLDGRKIKCTKEHKILTKNSGWKKAEDILQDDILLISPIGTEDITYEDEQEWKLELDDYTFHLQNEVDRNKALAFSRILGYIRTDGSIQKNGKVTSVFGTERDANDFINDCLLIINNKTKYKSTITSSNCIEVYITGKLAFLIKLVEGMPHGTRVSQKCDWPAFITDDKCPRAILREFIAGLFGGDGHSPCLIKAANTYTFSRINFSQSCCPKNKEHLIDTMNMLCTLLSKLDIHNSTITNIRNSKPTNNDTYRCGDQEHTSIRISLPASSSTFDTFMTNIGIRYCSHKLYRFEIAASWSRYMNSILYQYNTILKNAHQKSNMCHDKGRHMRSLEEAIKEFEIKQYALNTYYSKPSIELFYDYMKRVSKINQSFEYKSLKLKHIINAKEFIELTNTSHMFNNISNQSAITYATNRDGKLPVYDMKVINNRMNDTKDLVYDINVNHTHTFIANGIVVHNCIEPFTSNIYTRRTLAGEFIIVNKYLLQDLKKLDLWNEMMKQQIISRNGSVQGIDQIPEAIQKLYKTSWELKQKVLIDMAARRGAFICQSQSLNLFVADPNYAKLTSMHFYAWKQGLKTGIYYLRTRSPVMAQKFTIDPDLQKAAEKSEMMRLLKKNSEEECTMCGS